MLNRVHLKLIASPIHRSLVLPGMLLALFASGAASPIQLSGQESPMADPSPGGTLVSLAGNLSSILEEGGVPDTLEDLRLLEQQQQKVADAAEACTVSVQIGRAQGCGVIITESGYVLTAAHVAMRPNERAVITFSDGRKVWATTRGLNRNVDAGLIKINPGQNDDQPWPHASLGTSKNLAPGMWCIATGHPGGYRENRGTVTRVGRILSVRPGAIVTDCALIGGDSGGPLFDIAGRLIAVHSRIGNDVADNLHVPIDNYDFSWDRLRDGEAWGYLPGFRPVLGVQGQPSGEAEVTKVRENSPAAKAGILAGDVIVRFGRTDIADFAALKDAVSQTMPGEQVSVQLKRDGEIKRLRVEIGRAE